MDGKRPEHLVQELKLKQRRSVESRQAPQVDWRETVHRKPGEEVLKNLAVAASLVVCMAVLRNGAVPQLEPATDIIMTAVTGDTLLNEQLGKLSFVSAIFPEATLVFGEQYDEVMALPVSGGSVVHSWSESEPYMAWQTNSRQVKAALAGEVSAVFHGNGEERVVQVTSGNKLTFLYGNLAKCSVTVGDAVEIGDVLGELLEGTACVLEVRRDGYSIDPESLMGGAS